MYYGNTQMWFVAPHNKGTTTLFLDFDECEHNTTHSCAHLCVNTEGSYQCSCPEGYQLAPDGRNCSGIVRSSFCTERHYLYVNHI